MEKVMIEIHETKHIQTKEDQFVWQFTTIVDGKKLTYAGVEKTWLEAKVSALFCFAETLGVTLK